MYGLFGSVWALMQFVCSPLLGALSDRFGRRPVILLSNLGLGLDYILMALAPNLAWLFVGRIISGITGASFTTAAAYIADVTPPDKRAGSYGLIGAAWGLGFVLGPALGGVLGDLDPRMPFWVAAGMTLLNALYGFFVLPGQPPRFAQAAPVAPGAAWPGLGELPLFPRSPGAPERLCAVCRASLWLGCQDGRTDPGWSRHLQHCCPGRAGAPDDPPVGRAKSPADGTLLWRRGVRRVRAGQQRGDLSSGGSGIRADRVLQSGGATDDDPAGWSLGTGRTAGRQQQCHGDRRAPGPGAVYPDVRLLYPARRGLADSGGAVSAGRLADGGVAPACVAGDEEG